MTVTCRLLTAQDEAQLQAFWAEEPHGHLYAIPDLEYLGWEDDRLFFYGWFEARRLVGYLMLYGATSQWGFTHPEVAPAIAFRVIKYRVRYVAGLAKYILPVFDLLPEGHVKRYDACTVAVLPQGNFNANTLNSHARNATLNDLDAMAAVHVAAPDQFNQYDFATRRRALRVVLTDDWRRAAVATTHDGHIGAVAQTVAEGRNIAVIGGVVTHPTLRGQGLATAVTAHLSHQLQQEGKTVYLDYRTDNYPAAHIYAKIGFIPMDDAILAELNPS